jgi:hypothetical protein
LHLYSIKHYAQKCCDHIWQTKVFGTFNEKA